MSVTWIDGFGGGVVRRAADEEGATLLASPGLVAARSGPHAPSAQQSAQHRANGIVRRGTDAR
jgi:hypothetical protein